MPRKETPKKLATTPPGTYEVPVFKDPHIPPTAAEAASWYA